MRLTPALYSQQVDQEAGDYLLEVCGSGMEFCSWTERPRDLWSEGLVKIDGVVVPYLVDCAGPRERVRDPRCPQWPQIGHTPRGWR